MHSIVTIIHIFVSIFLIIVVLLQTGKGASMGAVFGGASNQTLFGSTGPAGFLTKLTAVCALIFMLTSFYLAFTASPKLESTVMKAPQSTQTSLPDKSK